MSRENSLLGLATIRSNRGITLEQIAESTKISIRSLRAIEQGEFEKLPGGIYNKSYIRQYAKEIDFDESKLLAVYNASLGSNAEAQDEHPPKNQTQAGGRLRAASILGIRS